MKELCEEFQKAREAAQLAKVAAETEKQAVYMLGVEETQARLTEELSAVCKEYCGISWGKALDATGVPVDSDLRQPKRVYYDPKVRELPSPDSSHPDQAPPALAQPLMDQAPPASSETLKESNQGKKITSSDPKEQAPSLAASQIDQTIDPLASKTKA